MPIILVINGAKIPLEDTSVIATKAMNFKTPTRVGRLT